MGVNYFTDEQVEILRQNKYVKNVSNKSITYDVSFKEYFIAEYESGVPPTTIFRNAGFDTDILGQSRITAFTQRCKAQSVRIDGFKDKREDGTGRPSTKDKTAEELLEIANQKIKVLRQENDFLKRITSLNRKYLLKKSKEIK